MKLKIFWNKREKLLRELKNIQEEINKGRDYINKFDFEEILWVFLLDKLNKIENKIK